MNYLEIENEDWQKQAQICIAEHGWEELSVGKIISEHKGSYLLQSPEGTFRAQLIGQLLYAAERKSDLPAVGDWVVYQAYDEAQCMIHGVLPRKTVLERATGLKAEQTQLIASNVDRVVVVMGADRDYNLNRVDRYVTLARAQHLDVSIVLTKIDLVEEDKIHFMTEAFYNRFEEIKIFPMNTIERLGFDAFHDFLKPGLTYCLVGSSGAGKSTLVNALIGKEAMRTSEISSSVNKGKHTTTHRQLIELSNGVLVIDNPGIREVGVGAGDFAHSDIAGKIGALAEQCRFTDCTHTNEPGCMILDAKESGKITQDAYQNYQKMKKETQHFTATEAERRRKGKALSKLINQHKKLK